MVLKGPDEAVGALSKTAGAISFLVRHPVHAITIAYGALGFAAWCMHHRPTVGETHAALHARAGCAADEVPVMVMGETGSITRAACARF